MSAERGELRMTREEAKEYLLYIFDLIGTTAMEYWTHADADKMRNAVEALETQPSEDKYEYHYDHTDCIWYNEGKSRCPVTCSQYRDGWNDAMQYIFRDGKGYRPYRRGQTYES